MLGVGLVQGVARPVVRDTKDKDNVVQSQGLVLKEDRHPFIDWYPNMASPMLSMYGFLYGAMSI